MRSANFVIRCTPSLSHRLLKYLNAYCYVMAHNRTYVNATFLAHIIRNTLYIISVCLVFKTLISERLLIFNQRQCLVIH
jgi:hypothetical protein